MLLTDARTGRLTPIRRGPGGLLRVCVHPAPAERRDLPGDLRALLVADVLFRIAELEDLQVITGYVERPLSGERTDALARAAGQVGIQPPAVHTPDAALFAAFGGPVDVRVLAPSAGVEEAEQALLVEVGPTRLPGGPDDLAADGADPLAVRLALLGLPYVAPAEIGAAALEEARAVLARWRARVAAWADAVSRPLHADTVERLRTAYEQDLDTPAVLDALSRLEADPDVPDGAKFETFVYADRVLSLELPREIGRT
ncbi:hypothetical protein ABZ858_06650 [Streptomyces sp. NPDC047017]|uniref:hypothetical protein n=1 Tax=Streptomyces sp. NPDC047017 TaxID=3155024 RepID=UPI0033CC588A